jgi:hypothetical protein
MRIEINKAGDVFYRAEGHFDRAFMEHIKCNLPEMDGGDNLSANAAQIGLLGVEMGYADFLRVLKYPHCMHRNCEHTVTLSNFIECYNNYDFIRHDYYQLVLHGDTCMVNGYAPLDDADAIIYFIRWCYYTVDTDMRVIHGQLLNADRLDKIEALLASVEIG